MTKLKKAKKRPTRTVQLPATQTMLYEVRKELKSDIRAIEEKLTFKIYNRFGKMETNFFSLQLNSMRTDTKIDSVEHTLKSEIQKLSSQVQQLMGLLEEQNRIKELGK